MEDRSVVIKRFLETIEEMIDMLEELERDDESESFSIPRQMAEDLREEFNDMM